MCERSTTTKKRKMSQVVLFIGKKKEGKAAPFIRVIAHQKNAQHTQHTQPSPPYPVVFDDMGTVDKLNFLASRRHTNSFIIGPREHPELFIHKYIEIPQWVRHYVRYEFIFDTWECKESRP